MTGYLAVWVSFALLSALLLASRAKECSGKIPLLQPLPSVMPQLTDCLMECTEVTFARKLQLQDKRNIRLQDSTEGNLGEYCWSTQIKCNVGESFQHAFVVLPTQMSAVGMEFLEVRWRATALHAHTASVTVPDACGLRYDVSEHFGLSRTATSFCVEVVHREDFPVLKCAPYLVTFWERSPTPI